MAIVDDTFGFGGPIKPTDSVQQVKPRRSADRRRPDEEDVEFDPVDQERPDEDEDRPRIETKSTNGRDPDVDILSEPRIGPREINEDGSLTQDVDHKTEDYKEDQRQSGQQQEEARERPNAPSEPAPPAPAPETPAKTPAQHRPGLFT